MYQVMSPCNLAKKMVKFCYNKWSQQIISHEHAHTL